MTKVRSRPAQDAAGRRYTDNHPRFASDRSSQMYLLTEQLARDRMCALRLEAEAQRLVRAAVRVRRAKRSSAKAVLRRRVVALATR